MCIKVTSHSNRPVRAMWTSCRNGKSEELEGLSSPGEERVTSDPWPAFLTLDQHCRTESPGSGLRGVCSQNRRGRSVDTKGPLSGKLSWERRRAGRTARNPLTSTSHSLTNARKTQVCKGHWIWLTAGPPWRPQGHQNENRIWGVFFTSSNRPGVTVCPR